jgi:hypothetical protein
MSGANAGTLFERHARSLRQYLRALTGRPDLADDLAQDVFVRVVQSAGAYEPRQPRTGPQNRPSAASGERRPGVGKPARDEGVRPHRHTPPGDVRS